MLPILAGGAAALTAYLTRRRVQQFFEQEVAERLPVGPEGIIRGAESIALTGSATHAVLILHGFNDTPRSVGPLAHALHEQGWTVVAPLLPSHGRTLRDAARGRAEDWLMFAREQYRSLRDRYRTVVVCGQSMGGALAALLAAKHPEMPALVLLAPYLEMPHVSQVQLLAAWCAQVALPYRRSTGGERSLHDPAARAAALSIGVITAPMITQLRRIAGKASRALPRVRVPTLYLQSRQDNRISVQDAERNFSRIAAEEKVQRWLTDCGHIIAADYCHGEVARQVNEWLESHAGNPRAIA